MLPTMTASTTAADRRGQGGDPERQLVVGGEEIGHVGGDAEHRGVEHGELAGEAEDQVEGDGEDAVDEGEDEDGEQEVAADEERQRVAACPTGAPGRSFVAEEPGGPEEQNGHEHGQAVGVAEGASGERWSPRLR